MLEDAIFGDLSIPSIFPVWDFDVSSPGRVPVVALPVITRCVAPYDQAIVLGAFLID